MISLRLPALAAVTMLCGCAMLEMPDFEQMHQRNIEDARAAIRADPSPQKRADAARELGSSDESAVPLLVDALSDSDVVVRSAAVDALRSLDERAKSASGEILAALQKESDPAAAVWTGWMLVRWDVDLRPAVPSLRAVLKQPDLLYRYHAAQLLQTYIPVEEILPVYFETLGTPIAKDVNNKPQDLIEDLIPSSGKAIWPMLENTSANSNAQRRAAVATLAWKFKPFPASGEKLLSRLLKDPDAGVRAAAAWACLMSEPEPVGTGPILLPMLDDPDADTRANVARAIGQYAALGKAPAGTLEALGQHMSDESEKVREYTANALQSIPNKPDGVVAQIVSRMDPREESSATVRAAAATALLHTTANEKSTAALRRGFDDEDETVRSRCLSMAGHLRISDPEILKTIADRTTGAYDKGERLNALGALRDIGPAALPVRDAVTRALNDPDADIREGAGYAATQMGL